MPRIIGWATFRGSKHATLLLLDDPSLTVKVQHLRRGIAGLTSQHPSDIKIKKTVTI
jgi:hypothetical protein